MKKKKILGITGIRSDYDLLSNLYLELNNDKDFELKLIVGNAHLSKTYGNSIENIKADGLEILSKIESLIDSDSKTSRIKSLSILLQNSVDIVSMYNPDLIIYAGDRFEVIVGALLGSYLEIPTIHFYGGDHGTDGHIDNSIRHATSKLSTFHFVTLLEHKERLIHLGEDKERIKVVGSIAIDRFINCPPTEIKSVLNNLSIEKNKSKYCILIYHPSVGEEAICARYFEIIIKALIDTNIYTFINVPNTDPGNKSLLDVIDLYKNNNNLFFFKNMDRKNFIPLFKNAEFIIGNSSAGILEAPSIPIPAINVGERQKGRLSVKNVIFVKNEYNLICQAINKALSVEFKESIRNIKNPYGNGKSTELAMKYIKETDFIKYVRKTEDPLTL
jgi:GDP/UDP-N,N'-diacetylbacillosamine 2-epimerase (hydrolysing)